MLLVSYLCAGRSTTESMDRQCATSLRTVPRSSCKFII